MKMKSRYLEVTVKVGDDGTLWTADGDMTMHSDRVETAKNRQVEAFTARIHDNGVDAVPGCVEVDQIHRRLETETHNTINCRLHLFILSSTRGL